LREDGPLVTRLGPMRIDDINSATLLEWWEDEIQGRRSRRTGLNFASGVSGVFRYARVKGYVSRNPVDDLRVYVNEEKRTKRGRAAETTQARPIRPAAKLAELVTAAEEHSLRAFTIVLCALDAGIRPEEIRGLEWGDVAFGEDDADMARHLHLQRAVASNVTAVEPLKGGYTRKVHLSRRLRRVLRAWRMASGNPADAARVFPGFRQNNWSRREWADIRNAAQIEGHRFYDLRHCYASYLMTAGFAESYLTRQLGHTPEVFRKHYACFMPPSDAYVEPMPLGKGEVPADTLVRLDRWEAHWGAAEEARTGGW
jgi:integrase